MSLPGLVSVVIPCFNAVGTLERAVRSALDNGHIVHEIILVDNNSTDGTFDLCLELRESIGNKIFVTQETLPGACNARNKGLSRVKTEWVQFLDADDWISPEKFNLQVAFARERAIDVVVSPFELVDRKGNITHSLHPEMPAEMGLMRGCLGTTGANLFRTSLVHSVNGWNPNWSSAQEYELMFRLNINGAKFGVHEETLFKYSSGVEGSISSGSSFKLKTNSLNLRRKMLEHFLRHDRSSEERQALMNGLFLQVRWALFINPTLALENWSYLRRLDYWPSRDTCLPLSYCLMIRVFGLIFTERIRQSYQKLKSD